MAPRTHFLDAGLAREAKEALGSVSRALLRLPPQPSGDYASGAAGIALTHRVLEDALPGRGHLERCQRAVGDAAERLASDELDVGLFGGIAGIGWAIGAVQAGATDDDAIVPIDDALLEATDGPWDREYDLVSGLVGVGLYALERLPRARARALLERVLDRLSELAQERDEGTVWVSDPELLPEELRGERTVPYLDCGVAHGIPGVLVLLAAAVARGIGGPGARTLLDGAVRWLLASRLPPGSAFQMPSDLIPGVPPRPSRLAWCYGDLGVGAALLSAGRAVGEPAWEAVGLEIARSAAAVSFALSGVQDAGLCHGAAGVVHVMHRLYGATGELAFRAAARRWLRVLLAMRRPGRAVAGFPVVVSPGAGPVSGGRPGLLAGTAGVGLVLASALGHEPVRWDAPLLLADLVPR